MAEASVTVGELVAERPSRSRVFERMGIDYCCGGRQALSVACAARGLAVEAVWAELGAEAEAGAGEERDWRAASLTELCDHIVATHHAWLKEELPRLAAMARKVRDVHGSNHPWMIEAAQVYEALARELEQHMFKEENILFPFVRTLDQSPGARGPFGSVANPIAMMEHEHDDAGQALARLRELSDGYTPPEGACNTFRALLDGLAELEADLHVHIHKENNILFPRAVAAERG
jgi:regulator of cell morphogenesis and NO signaling